MAASDKPFRDQRTLDIVFAVSNILMLLSVVWMFTQDYYREHRAEQRIFRDLEYVNAQRAALEAIPSEEEFAAAEKKVNELKEERVKRKDELASAHAVLSSLRPAKEKAEVNFQTVNADVDSFTSLLAIAIEHGDKDQKKYYEDLLTDRNAKLVEVRAKRDEIANKMKAEQIKIEQIEGGYTKAVAEFKKVNDRFDTQVKLALNKRWGWGDWLRTQPVINGFADPLKIHQFTIEDITIDYNFKKVTRFDRCMSCHVGIDRPSFSRENLMSLTKEDVNKSKLDEAMKLYQRRIAALDPKDQAVIPNPGHMNLLTISDKVLTPARVTEFCAHPRLDLFVGSNSKHPAEKFGCTSCHSGQGSGTSFIDASHSPDSTKANQSWTKERGWTHNHMWDFPMLPKRFIESSCLKCHHEVTDLISSDNRVEAPKLLRGYNLIKENGCFGCHEISGYKGGERVGPDLRLEPNPPLEDLIPSERTRVENDPDNRPGNLRKVGPALSRVSEKVTPAWIEKWLRSPSAFRPDTKMPHYYGLSTNLESELPDGQKKFPNAEIASIAHYLTATSKGYLAEAAKHQKDTPEARQKDQEKLVELLSKGRLAQVEQDELADVKKRIKLRKEVPLVDLAPMVNDENDADKKKRQQRGRILFTERGCLACHTHQGTETKQDSKMPELVAPAVHSDAVFGPDLSQVAEKLGNSDAARAWLIQWIVNPQVHSPRSRMPVTHLTPSEAADIALWLLGQTPARGPDDPWNTINVAQPTKDDLKNLARVYLTRMMSKSDMESFLDGKLKGTDWEVVKGDVTKDEMQLKDKTDDENELKFYLGKKAVTRLGCFACHDIPGMESVKPIGVGLLDWGKKPADRLAFEDINNFFNKHYQTEDPHNMKDGKEPYEPFYAEALMGHHRLREGYLNQKIRDPRSYDYNRIRAWDDRSRMPKFTLARPRKKAEEKDGEFKGRIYKEEAEAREAVATFVLGLVAEQVPTKSINQPKGDRLAEVKGRQILDKYNCAGCHTIRPGVYDFKLGPKSLENLEDKHAAVWKEMQGAGEIIHLNHINWVGRNPIGGDRLTAYGSQPTFLADEDKPSQSLLVLRLNEGLRFVGKDKNVKSIPAGVKALFPLEDMVANPAAIKTQAEMESQFRTTSPYGGAFPDLLVPYLTKKDDKKYPFAGGDSAEARASLPPSLVGQGERTQPGWLHQFLLDPQPVRRMTILRMPKFNMSNKEAEALVEYFAAVTRLTNPGIGLASSHEVIQSRSDLSSDYWRKKTADYLAQIKTAKEKDKDGKVKASTIYEDRIAAYTPYWEQIRKEKEPELKSSVKSLDELIKNKKSEKEATEKALLDKPGKKVDLEKELEAIKVTLNAATEEKEQAEKALARLDVKTQQKTWETEEAYASDAYRLVMSRELCTKCHQLGSITASEQGKQGPPLDLAFARLRPDWVERWVDQPQRFLPYPSIMPPYFDRNLTKYQNLHAGVSEEQIRAVRDALMNYPRLSTLPINRLYNPDRPVAK